MLQKDCDWEGELQRLLQPAGTEGAAKEVPMMKVEGGPLVSFNSYDRRYEVLGYQCLLTLIIGFLFAYLMHYLGVHSHPLLIQSSYIL